MTLGSGWHVVSLYDCACLFLFLEGESEGGVSCLWMLCSFLCFSLAGVVAFGFQVGWMV